MEALHAAFGKLTEASILPIDPKLLVRDLAQAAVA